MTRKTLKLVQQHKKPVTSVSIVAGAKKFEPITESQCIAFDAYKADKNLFLYGYPGTGKTYLACAFGVEALREKRVNSIRIIRSNVAGRDIGFLPGTEQEKMAVFEKPYEAIFREIFGRGDAYEILKQKQAVFFDSTSFQRGLTFDDTFLIVDEFQNMSFEELNTIITRIGKNTQIVFSGDIRQCDFAKSKSGFAKMKEVLTRLEKYFTLVEMDEDDIVRSDLVRDYIIAVESLKNETESKNDDFGGVRSSSFEPLARLLTRGARANAA